MKKKSQVIKKRKGRRKYNSEIKSNGGGKEAKRDGKCWRKCNRRCIQIK